MTNVRNLKKGFIDIKRIKSEYSEQLNANEFYTLFEMDKCHR